MPEPLYLEVREREGFLGTLFRILFSICIGWLIFIVGYVFGANDVIESAVNDPEKKKMKKMVGIKGKAKKTPQERGGAA